MGAQSLTPLGPGPSNNPIGVSGQNPAVQYFPAEAGGIYEEQREVAGMFWQVQNATYNQGSSQWLLVDPSKPGRAFVSGNGQTAFYHCPAQIQPVVWTEKWYITDGGVAFMSGLNLGALPYNVDLSQLGIYNVRAPAYNAIPDVNTTAQAAANMTAIQNACNDAITNGGLVWFPTSTAGGATTYWTNPGIVVTSSTRMFGMMGTTAGARIRVPLASGGGNLLTLSTTGGTPGLVVISTLSFQYDVPLTGYALYVHGAQGVQIQDCFFDECPSAVYSDSSLQLTISNCTMATLTQFNCQTVVLTGVGGPGSGTQVATVQGCIIRSQLTQGNTAIVVGQAVVFHISECQIATINNGIQIISGPGGGTKEGYISNCNVLTGGSPGVPGGCGLLIQPALNTSGNPYAGGITEIKVSDCLFRHGHWHANPYDSIPGIYIDTNGGANALVTGVILDDVTVDSFGGPGVQYNGGQHLSITGGRIAGNALINKGGTAGQIAGLSVTGPVAGLSVRGTEIIGSSGIEPGLQPYGVLLSNGCANIFISDVNARGNTLGAFTFASPGSPIEIIDCQGYNDQGAIIATAFPTGSFATPITSPQIGSTAGWSPPANPVVPIPYYGPVECYMTSGGGGGTLSSIKTGQPLTNIGITAGTVTVHPGGQDVLQLGGSGTINFVAKGI